MMDINAIMDVLPHRHPFLLVDRILEVEDGKRVVGIKNVTANEPFFQGHFPGYPVMPGVLIIEAMAQVGAVAILRLPAYAGRIPFFAGIDGARFRRPVRPGDRLRLEAEVVKIKGTVGKSKARAFVDDQLVAEAELMFAIGKAE